jgi:hypothetical protein
MRNAVIGDDDRRCGGGMAARVAVRLLDSDVGGMGERINTRLPTRQINIHSLSKFNTSLRLSTTVNMKYATVLLAAAATVSAHSTWQELWVGSEDKAGTCVRTVKDNSPVTGLTSPDMFCGRGPAASSGVCEVAGMSP